MGLDMYLYIKRSKYNSFYDLEEKSKLDLANKYPVILEELEADIRKHNFRSYEITEKYQVGYWRKFNALHGYIVKNFNNNVDDCNNIELTSDQIKELLKNIELVLEDHNKAKELLPTREGFFFGDTNYDDYYFEDLQYTKEVIMKVLRVFNKLDHYNRDEDKWKYSIVYRASW